ncbi:MAG TPA: hypothetical protein VFY79_02110, partial [Dehalococcoidia bacterium]|nr:hypothetical protein [Dehalococcoidia bacterium]
MPFPAATRLTKRLGDPHSLAFYRRIAATVPEHRVFEALSETRIASRKSRIRRSRGAYFTRSSLAMPCTVANMARRATGARPVAKPTVKTHFTDYFDVPRATLEKAGAFNISLINDLPLFIDPFLLFNSQNPAYRQLHDDIIKYLRFLRDKAATGSLHPGLIRAWYTFAEVKQTWLGFSQVGNAGHGLGRDFALALHRNLHSVFA